MERSTHALEALHMQLRGINFGNVFCAAGARNFFGTEADAYWFHRLLRILSGFVAFVLRRPWGLNYAGSTFVAKTTTAAPRVGNMPLVPGTVRPWEYFPRCIVVNFWGAYALNKVGLSGPGASWLFDQGLWQKRQEPFMLSFMAVSADVEDRLDELQRFTLRLFVELDSHPELRSRLALEVNLSCPNVGLDQAHLVEEASEMSDRLRMLGIPFGFKLSVEIEPEVALRIAEHSDFITVTNTIAFGKLPNQINWRKLFGSDTSPLANVGAPGGGGLSGRPLLPLVIEWIRAVRALGMKAPIIGGGGILAPQDARNVLAAGATAISVGCISMLRPWRLAGTIRAANEACRE